MSEIFEVQSLKHIVNKIERLEEQKSEIAEEIRDVYKQAQSEGFDTSAIKQVIKLRKIDKTKLAEQEEILSLYKEVFGL